MILAHSIRLDPNDKQKSYFRRACSTSRWAYNWALAEWKKAYEAGEKPSGRALKKKLNAIRHTDFPWTGDVHRDCTARPFDDLQAAFQHFFRRVKSGERPGYPKFKKKGRCKDSFYAAADKVRFDGERVRLPVVGWIRTMEALRFDGKVLGVTVSRTADRWHVAVQVDVGDARKDRVGDAVVGVDLGIKASATLSTGEVVDGPKALQAHIKRLKRLSRRHSRKQRGSNNQRKAAMLLAKLHNRIGNIREDHLHKLSTRLVSENQAVGIEGLAVGNMVRNHKLARAILDEGWAELRRMIDYKALMYGTEVVIHDRWFPSSKACSGCGVVKDVLLLSDRVYECDACGVVLDRDHNAALNLRPIGLPGGTGNEKPVEIAALTDPSGSAKLRSLKQESSGCSPEMVAV
uniref:Putative transposase n=1 Tax=viral metagenome TaxID=1070528 RepID=A0A6H1Z8H3_9ZZZZ